MFRFVKGRFASREEAVAAARAVGLGMSPLEYLTLLRVEHAKELLASTDLTIREISARTGYYDAGSFIRRFKQVTGETPLQYRRGRGGRETAPESGPEGEEDQP